MLHLDPGEAAPGPEPGDLSDPPTVRALDHGRHAAAPGPLGAADPRRDVPGANPAADREAHTPAKEG
ncbi:hypothetical protein [Streptomyces sp. NPDC003393]